MGDFLRSTYSQIDFRQLEPLNPKEIIEEKYLIKNKLIVNSQRGNLLDELKLSMEECNNFYFSVAFINFSGLQLLLDSFKGMEERNIKGKIITSTYLNFTEPKALEKLKGFENIDLKILEYFKPKFLLGMTATPERCDRGNIFDAFDNNIACEIRLHEALENELIVPFHYFGITDIDDADIHDVELDNIAELSKRLMINKRVDFIVEKMNFYGFDGNYQKTVGFCVNKEHAAFMAEEFNKKGIESIALTGDDSVEKRLPESLYTEFMKIV